MNRTSKGAWSAGTPGTDVTAINLELKDIQLVVVIDNSKHWRLQMPCQVHKYNLVWCPGVWLDYT